MHRASPLLALLVVAILTGCGGGEGGGDGAETSDTGAVSSGPISVSATDFAFSPAELAAEPGTVEIELVNDGEMPHAIAIDGVDASSETIDPGGTTTLSVELEEGTYEVYCPVEGHREAGMVGTLTVGAGGTPDGETDTGGGSDDDSPRY